MKKAYKIEFIPSEIQKQKIHQTIGNCRFLYNRFIGKNKELYEHYVTVKENLLEQGFALEDIQKDLPSSYMGGFDFDKYINNELSKQIEFQWIKSCSSKARKQAIMNADKAFKDFFKGNKGFPKFKKKSDQDVKAYFPKNNATDWKTERHRINIPTIGWVKLKEFGYLPKHPKITSGTVSQQAGRYYVSVLVEEAEIISPKSDSTVGIGVDLGLKEFAIMSDGTVFHNINKAKHVRKLEKQLKQAQRKLSRQYEQFKIYKKRGGSATEHKKSNINKQTLRVQKLHTRLSNIQEAYRQQVITDLVKTKPQFVTLEKLNIKGMMKNKHLSKAIQAQSFYDFKEKLISRCDKHSIEVREVGMWFPSSKTCHACGAIKKDLKLNERVYRCLCGYENDRDLNAALNLRDATEYAVLN